MAAPLSPANKQLLIIPTLKYIFSNLCVILMNLGSVTGLALLMSRLGHRHVTILCI
jgi:hypothetical protein